MLTSIASIAAAAASTAAPASMTDACAALIEASAAASCASAAASAAWAASAAARSLSRTDCEMAFLRASGSDRASWRCAASLSARRWATTASAARSSAWRWRTRALAVWTPISARRSSACAWRSCASGWAVSMRASSCPAVTKSPSLAMMSAIRPATLAEMSISVASMRPLLLANPSGSPPPPSRCQATTARTARRRAPRPPRSRPRRVVADEGASPCA